MISDKSVDLGRKKVEMLRISLKLSFLERYLKENY